VCRTISRSAATRAKSCSTTPEIAGSTWRYRGITLRDFLMSNHVHLLAVPETAESLRCTLGQTHHDYARYRNARRAMCGHLWQSRYYSCPVDEPGVWTVLAYIERNRWGCWRRWLETLV
jgi:REP element-mobilizing transposase RayT